MAEPDITWDDVVLHAAGVSTVPTDAQTDILALVNGDQISTSALRGQTLRMARIWMAAHLGWGARPGASPVGGQVSSESAGGLSRSYAVVPSDDDLDGTIYGKKYLALVRRALGGPAVV